MQDIGRHTQRLRHHQDGLARFVVDQPPRQDPVDVQRPLYFLCEAFVVVAERRHFQATDRVLRNLRGDRRSRRQIG